MADVMDMLMDQLQEIHVQSDWKNDSNLVSRAMTLETAWVEISRLRSAVTWFLQDTTREPLPSEDVLDEMALAALEQQHMKKIMNDYKFVPAIG